MRSRLAQLARPRPPSWWWYMLLAIAGLGLVVLSVLVFPSYLVEHSVNEADNRALSPADRLKAEDDVRSTLLQAVAGLLLAVGATAAWRQAHINREGQITERFNKAIEHLRGSSEGKLDVRLGGIYALERIARSSKDDREAVAEILTAYVRGHAAWSHPSHNNTDHPLPPTDTLEGLRARKPDVQAAMKVLGRRKLPPGKTDPLLLIGVELREVGLRKAHLEGADLRRAHLERADLHGAHLEGADLRDAHLDDANLRDAHLDQAHFAGAHLEQADFAGAHLKKAIFDYDQVRDPKRPEFTPLQLEEALVGPADFLKTAVFDDAQKRALDRAPTRPEGILVHAANRQEPKRLYSLKVFLEKDR